MPALQGTLVAPLRPWESPSSWSCRWVAGKRRQRSRILSAPFWDLPSPARVCVCLTGMFTGHVVMFVSLRHYLVHRYTFHFLCDSLNASSAVVFTKSHTVQFVTFNITISNERDMCGDQNITKRLGCTFQHSAQHAFSFDVLPSITIEGDN